MRHFVEDDGEDEYNDEKECVFEHRCVLYSADMLRVFYFTCAFVYTMVACMPHMAKTCPITQKTSQVGGRYSNRTRATQFNPCGKTRRQVNLKKVRVFVPELDKNVQVTISAKAIKTIQKNGAYATLKKAGLI